MGQESEAELLARCRRGEAAAWDELFDRHYAAAGLGTVEFLAGHEDYKRRLSTNHRPMVWLEVQRPGVRTALLRAYRALRRRRREPGAAND